MYQVQNYRVFFLYARVSTNGQSVDAQVRQLCRGGRHQGLPGDGSGVQDKPFAAAPRPRGA